MINSTFGQSNDLQDNFEENRNKIYPIIKVEISNKSESEPDLKFQENEGPIFEKIGGDLLLFYGIDKGDGYQIILENDIPETISIDSLKTISITNLEKLVSENIQLSETNFGGKMLVCGHNFESSLVLINWLWKSINEMLDYEYVIAIPSKDLVFIADKNNTDQINGMIEKINEVHQNGEFLLSKKIYTISNNNLIEIEL